MNVATSIKELSDLRDKPELELSTTEFEAIGVAICIMASLEPHTLALVDSILAEAGIGRN